MIKRTWTVCVCTLVVVFLASSTSFATTELAKRAAIDSALEWLAIGQQASDGRWEGGAVSYDQAHTSAALLAFMEEGYIAGAPVVLSGTDYGDVVGDGLKYMFTQMTGFGLGVGVPGDTNSFGVGYNYSYVDGLALTSIASSGTPNALAVGTSGSDVGTPWAGRVDGSGAGGAWTHRDVAQNMVDYLVWGQVDTGTFEGAWDYNASGGMNSSTSSADNSTAQWPAIGLVVANAKMSIPTPAITKSQLATWIEYIQYMGGVPFTGIHGSSGYTAPTQMNNESKTGGLLVEMLLAGQDTGGTAYDLTHPRLIAAMDYLDRQWQATQSGTWYGNFGHPYAMWSVYKGLEVWLGTTGAIGQIGNLHAAQPMDAGDTWNYWEDYCDWLVNNMNGDHWDGYSYWTGAMATGWDINILNATEISGPYIPEPLTMLGVIAGLGGLAGYIRRRRAA